MFVVRGRKEENKLFLEGITNFIMKSWESYDGKIIIITFEMPIINWISNYFLEYWEI